MKLFEWFTACSGGWRGQSVLHFPHAGSREESSSTANLTVLPEGSIRLDYTWAYQGQPQYGSLQVQDDRPGVSASWTDTWHTGNQPMTFFGVYGNALSLRGSYAAPPGPDWGWRIDLTAGGGQLRLLMWNIHPAELGGKEELAVEAVYVRS